MAVPIKDTLPHRPGIVFMGTPDFSVFPLQALITEGHRVLAVVTQPDRPRGRGKKNLPTPVKRLAMEHRLKVLQPEKVSDKGFCDVIRNIQPDLVIVVAFGQILRKDLLNIPKWGAINIHASLLPKYRGAAPIQWAILEDQEKTGLTIMRMDEGLDTGPILFQEEIAILRDETAGHLHDRLAEKAGPLIIRTLQEMSARRVEERPQEHDKATHAPKIEKHMTGIDWALPAQRIAALVRALDPFPGARTTLAGKEVKVFSPQVLEGEGTGDAPGTVLNHAKDALVVNTSQGAVALEAIQAPGKRRMPMADFLRGFPVPEKTVLGL